MGYKSKIRELLEVNSKNRFITPAPVPNSNNMEVVLAQVPLGQAIDAIRSDLPLLYKLANPFFERRDSVELGFAGKAVLENGAFEKVYQGLYNSDMGLRCIYLGKGTFEGEAMIINDVSHRLKSRDKEISDVLTAFRNLCEYDPSELSAVWLIPNSVRM